MRRGQIGTTFALTLALACLPAAAHAGPRPAKPEVKTVTSGDFSERTDRIGIERRPGRGEEVVMSLTPKRLPSLAAGDRLELSTELQVSVDCTHPSRRCVGNPYHYNPAVRVRMLIGSSPDDVGGRGTRSIGKPTREVCRQRSPNREHHCVITFKRNLRSLPGIPCVKRRRCFVNLVAGATSRRAHRGDVVTVGGIRPNGSVPQDRARLNLVRFHPALPVPHRLYSTDHLVNRRLDLDQRREVIYTERIDGLREGAQLVADARARVDIRRLPYNVVLSSQLILTDRREAVTRGGAAKLASMRGEFDEGNGFNCTQSQGICTIHKVGVLTMLRDAPRGRPLFVTLVTRAGPKSDSAMPGDHVVTRRGGALSVTRYSSRYRG